MPTNINFNKKLGLKGGTAITLPTSSTPSFQNLNSFSFDGVDDTFLIPTLPSTFTDLSISFWLKKGVDSTNAYVFARSTSQWLIFQNGTNNSLKYRLITNGGTYTKIGGAILDSQWHHCAFVWDSSANTFDIFEDGVKIGTSTTTSGSLISSTVSAYIFSYVNGAPYSSGKVDELAIFDSALSQSDVTAIYNNGEPQSLDAYSPLVWFRMGDNATWNGATWTMTSVGTDTRIARSINMVEANRTTDVPPNPFANTQSIALDGVDDYVSVANNTTIARTQTISYSIWVNLVDGSARQYIIGNQTSSNGGTGLSIESGGFLLFQVADGTNDSYFNSKVTNFTTYAPNNTWNHILATFDGVNAKIFINGILRNNWSVTTPYTISNYSNFWIGRRNANTSQLTNGKLDEIALFNTDQSANASTIYNGGVPNDISSLSPVSWWRFEGSGTTATDSGSGGNNGTLVNGVVRSTDVPTASTFSNTLSTYFDGIDDRVEINRTLGSGYAELSISTWVKYNNNLATSNKYHPIVAKIGPSFGNSFVLQNIRSGASSNGGELYFNVQTPNGIFNAFSGVVPSQNVWYNIVGTYDGSNVKIYIDGVLKATTSASGNINSNTELMMLGDAGHGGFSAFLNGNLDEVSIYSRGLTQSEVTNIYNSGTPNDVSSISDIEAWLRMGDGDTANTITDNVGSNNGTMVNMNSSNFVTDVPTIPFSTRSIALDGVDDYVSTGLNLSYTTYPNVSFSCWIKMDKASLNTFTSYSPTGAYVQVFPNSSPIRIYTDGSKNAYVRIQGNGTSNTTTDLADGNWHHIVQTCRYESTGTVCNVYIDGAQEITNQLFLSYAPITGDFFIGARTATTQFFVGGIDEVAVFDSELSQSNVTSIYNGGVPNDISSLNPLSWWRCGDGDTAPTLTDNGSGGNDGTMTNFTTFSTDVPT